MNMIDWYKKAVFENYANFSGRAPRSEYWYFVLCNFLISIIFYIPLIITIATSENGEPNALFFVLYGILGLYSLAVFIPSIAVLVRRMHDIGKSGWSIFIYLIPLVGPILILVWLCTDSEHFTNKWGPNPKASKDEINEIGKSSI